MSKKEIPVKDREFSFNATLSIRKNQPFGDTVTLGELFELVRTDKDIASLCELYRTGASPRAKTSLPIVTPAAVCDRNSADSEHELSGLVCIDVDKKDNPNTDILESLFLSSVAAGWHLSAGGEGYAVYFVYSHGDLELAVLQAKYHLQGEGLVVDNACLTNINSFRFVAHDADAHLHDDAPVLDQDAPALPRPERLVHTDVCDLSSDDLATLRDREKTLKVMSKINPEPLDYHEWMNMLWAARRTGVTSEEFHTWCSGMESDAGVNPKYDYAETEKEWCKREDSKRNTKVKLGTVVKMARDQGHKNPLLELSNFSDFIIENSDTGTIYRHFKGVWSPWGKPALRHLCKEMDIGYDEFSNQLYENNRVSYVGKIGGHTKGLNFLCTNQGDASLEKFLNPVDTTCIRGEMGDWSRLRTVIESIVCGGQPNVERPKILKCFYSDLKHARVYTSGGRLGHLNNGQVENYRMRAMAFAGDPSTGKSFMVEAVMGRLLGNLADGSRWLKGADGFNSEVAEATVVTMDDVSTGTAVERRNMTENFKEFVATGSMRVRAMRKAAVRLPTKSVLVFAINNTPESIRGLPKLDGANRDKINIYQFAGRKLEAPGWRESGKTSSQILTEIVEEEIKAFAWWLDNEFEIAEKDLDPRWGSPSYINDYVSETLYGAEYETKDTEMLAEAALDSLEKYAENMFEDFGSCSRGDYLFDPSGAGGANTYNGLEFRVTTKDLMGILQSTSKGLNALRAGRCLSSRAMNEKLRQMCDDPRIPINTGLAVNNRATWSISRDIEAWEKLSMSQ